MDALLKVIEEWGWWYEGNKATVEELLSVSAAPVCT